MTKNELPLGEGQELIKGLEIGEQILKEKDGSLYHGEHKIRKREQEEGLDGVIYNVYNPYADSDNFSHNHTNILTDKEGREICIGDESISSVTVYGYTNPYDAAILTTEGVKDSRTVAYTTENSKFKLLDFAGIELKKPHEAAGDNIDSSHIKGLFNINPADQLVDGKYEKVRECTLNEEGQRMVFVDGGNEYDVARISFHDAFGNDIQQGENKISPSQIGKVKVWYYTNEDNYDSQDTSISFLDFLDKIKARNVLDTSEVIKDVKGTVAGTVAAA